jgi:drug/metabolite transporter (DMT)-like permease
VFIWGGTYPGVKALQAVIPPVALVTFRCLVGTAVLLSCLALAPAQAPRPSAAEWRRIALLGLAGNTVFQLCMVGGLHYTTAAHSALAIALNPVFAVLLARVWLDETLGPRQALGILLAFAGVAAIIGRGGALAGGGSLRGDLLSLGAALAWAVYSVFAKPVLAARPPLDVTARAMLVGTIPLLPLGLPELVAVPWAALTPATWLLLAYLSVLTLGLTYILWYWALARAATGRVVAFTYLTPVVAVAIAAAVGQEALTLPLVAAAAAVVGGVALAAAPPRARLTREAGGPYR